MNFDLDKFDAWAARAVAEDVDSSAINSTSLVKDEDVFQRQIHGSDEDAAGILDEKNVFNADDF